MEKEFVPYDIALALKELGFDERCLKGFYKKEIIWAETGNSYDFNSRKPIEHFVSAPLYQQVFRWFREKYFITQYVYFDFDDIWSFRIDNGDTGEGNNGFVTYEEAELACLRKLIEIVKENPTDK